ncbi:MULTISPECIES: SDR family oxidoreductase [Ochrobactrum]|uniref:SDR family oxidoreductase n=1 Tax=Ochrobactrum TaxID=528 RepID=UPI00399A42CD
MRSRQDQRKRNSSQTRPVAGKAEKTIIATIPMRRLGTTDEVAAAIRYFLSRDASFVAGQILSVDGGGSLGGRRSVY